LAEPGLSSPGTATPIRASVGLVEVNRDDERAAEEILRAADSAIVQGKAGPAAVSG